MNVSNNKPELAEGESYAGILIGSDGHPDHHIILLADEMEGEADWADAKEWAESVGGSLPTRREQSLLFANLKAKFQPDWYWSGEQHAELSGCAWCQTFSSGYQDYYRKGGKLRARAVRRLVIE